MGRMKELLMYVEEEFSPPDRESAQKIAKQLLKNPALYLKKFAKNGTKNESETSDRSMASGESSTIEDEQPL